MGESIVVAALEVHSISSEKALRQKGQLAVVKGISEASIQQVNCKLHLKVPYSLIHATPGRLRFRVPRLTWDAHYAHRLQVLLQAADRVTQVQIKPAAMSVAVKYQTGQLGDEQMSAYLGNLIQLATTAIVPATSDSDKTESQSSWSDLKFPALATLLALLAGQ